MAVPKRKMSRANTRTRRSTWKADLTELNTVKVAGREIRVPRARPGERRVAGAALGVPVARRHHPILPCARRTSSRCIRIRGGQRRGEHGDPHLTEG